MHLETVSVWYNYWAGRVIDTNSLENDVGQATTANDMHYRMMTNSFSNINGV